MKILQVVSYFPPDRIGGVGEVAAHIHRGLLEAGHDSVVLTTGPTRDDPRVIPVARSPGRFGIASLRRWRLSADVDVIHAHHGEALPFLLAARLRRDRPRILVTFHIDNRALGDSYRAVMVDSVHIGGGWDAWVQRRVKSRLKALLDMTAMALADEVSFISRSTAEDVLGSTAAETATIVYNAPPARTTGADSPGVESTELLFVGTASARKRTDLLPSILEAVRRDFPGARLRIVGFDLPPELRSRLGERGLLAGVICEGPVRSDQLDPFYRSATVLIVPSAYEGLPMVIMEAFAAGLPCVAADVGGASEIVEDGMNGFLVPADDIAALAKRCHTILANPTRRREMGENARAAASRFGLDRQLAGYVQIYDRLVARSARL